MMPNHALGFLASFLPGHITPDENANRDSAPALSERQSGMKSTQTMAIDGEPAQPIFKVS
jgi:hypothetical protein